MNVLNPTNPYFSDRPKVHVSDATVANVQLRPSNTHIPDATVRNMHPTPANMHFYDATVANVHLNASKVHFSDVTAADSQPEHKHAGADLRHRGGQR